MGYHGLNDGKWLARNELAGELRDTSDKKDSKAIETTEQLKLRKDLVNNTWKLSQRSYEDIVIRDKNLVTFREQWLSNPYVDSHPVTQGDIIRKYFKEPHRVETEDIKRDKDVLNLNMVMFLETYVSLDKLFNKEMNNIDVYLKKIEYINTFLAEYESKLYQIINRHGGIWSNINQMSSHTRSIPYYLDTKQVKDLHDNIEVLKRSVSAFKDADNDQLLVLYTLFYNTLCECADALSAISDVVIKISWVTKEYYTIHEKLSYAVQYYADIKN